MKDCDNEDEEGKEEDMFYLTGTHRWNQNDYITHLPICFIVILHPTFIILFPNIIK